MIADLHIHSRYSMATGRQSVPEYLDLWARKKGISVLGTGDFTHPAWRAELKEKLVPAEEGLYTLKESEILPESLRFAGEAPRFLISGEISSIYKKDGKTRRVHSLLLLPGLEAAERLAQKLEAVGNIRSDGRPILGLSCRDLLEMMLDAAPDGLLIPAHIWTPHFSLFGAFSGFDAAEECFEDLTPFVYAMETGLSSDPPMNRRISMLDRFQLVSSSDAHSPAKLGREATVFETERTYSGMREAMCTGQGLSGTIEFFPQEGKYHSDGHRKCGVCLAPSETERYGGKCPVCGRKLTVGVEHRIEQLSDRTEEEGRRRSPQYESLVPLPEVIAAACGRSASSKGVQKIYEELLLELGPECEILRRIPAEEIGRNGRERIAEGIRRLRDGEVSCTPGFDGEYGKIRLFDDEAGKNGKEGN